jgi:hypothetical protein
VESGQEARRRRAGARPRCTGAARSLDEQLGLPIAPSSTLPPFPAPSPPLAAVLPLLRVAPPRRPPPPRDGGRASSTRVELVGTRTPTLLPAAWLVRQCCAGTAPWQPPPQHAACRACCDTFARMPLPPATTSSLLLPLNSEIPVRH